MARLARITRGVRLVGCCDISMERAEGFAKRHRIPRAYNNYEEMLGAVRMDAAYLAVPHFLHYGMLKRAVDAGKHVFVEKPITRTTAEGAEIVAYAGLKQIKIGVNYQYRYDAACYRLAHLVQSGQLGRILYARTNIPWHRGRDYFEDSGWHKSLAQAGGGTLITQASHLIDVLLWAIGSPAVSASGVTAQKVFRDVEVEDFAAGIVELENGAVIQVTSSMVAATEQAVTVEVYGERGTAVYTNRPWPRLRYIKGKEGGRARGLGELVPGPSVVGGRGRVPYFGMHAMQRCLKGFRDWVLFDQPFLIPGVSALPALRVVEAIYQSAQEGQVVRMSI
jgi:predicted dehydrogenase